MYKLLTLASLALLGSSEVHKKVEPIGHLVQGDFSYACTMDKPFANAGYLKHSKKALDFFCSKIVEGETYALEAGATLTKKGNECSLNFNSTVNPTKVICTAEESGDDYQVLDKDIPCPEDSTPMSYGDAVRHAEGICNYLEIGDKANIEFDYIIVAKEFFAHTKLCLVLSIRNPGQKTHVCATPAYKEIDIETATTERSCPEGESLLTMSEVESNKEAYCKMLEEVGFARLAGGAGLVQDNNLCHTFASLNERETPAGKMKKGICGKEGRQMI